MVFRHIPLGGCAVRIGSRDGAHSGRPVRKVSFAQDWYLSETVVTQAQWIAVMGAGHEISVRQSFPDRPEHPVTDVSWDDAREFCAALQAFVPVELFARQPTEAEWEASARAGSCADSSLGDGVEAIERGAWVHGTAGERTHAVDSAPDPVPPHPFGLVGLHGNVWEWCEDLYWDVVGLEQGSAPVDPCHVDQARFTGSPAFTVVGARSAMRDRPDVLAQLELLVHSLGEEELNRRWAAEAGEPTRVVRGGSWFNWAAEAASAFRIWRRPGVRIRFDGLRVCLSPRPSPNGTVTGPER